MRKLGVVEDAVQDAKERLPRTAALVDQGAVFGTDMLAHHLENLQHAVHRRSDLVAHVGGESRFGGVGLFGGEFCAF